MQAWQIGNELDWHQFSGPLNARQASDYILAGARGLKASDPALIIGHNPTGGPKSYFFYARLFGDGLMDYCGIDRYYGSWQPGGPEDWNGQIEELWDLTQAPVFINEWGFSSAGGVMTDGGPPRGHDHLQVPPLAAHLGRGPYAARARRSSSAAPSTP